MGKQSACQYKRHRKHGFSPCEDQGLEDQGQEDPLEEGMTTYSSFLAWRIPWTEEPGGLQSMGSQSVRRD